MKCKLNIQFKKNGNILQRIEGGRVINEISLVNMRMRETPQGLIVLQNGANQLSFGNKDNRYFFDDDGAAIDVNANLYEVVDDWRKSVVSSGDSSDNNQLVSLGSINLKLCSDNG